MLKKTPEDPVNPHHLAPLDEIRQEEAKIARQILRARQQAAAALAAAREQAEALKSQARLAGRQDGVEASHRQVAEAQREAERILVDARAQAAAAADQAARQVEPAAAWAESVVLGLDEAEARP